MYRSLVIIVAPALLCACDPSPSSPDTGGDLPPQTFVNGKEGQLAWANPSQPPYDGTRGEFRGATAWLSMVDDQRVTDGSYIEVDYLRMFARAQGVQYPVSSDEYNSSTGDGPGGGLFERVPWFGNQGLPRTDVRSQSTVQNGVLILPIERCSDCVWHVWVEDYPRPLLRPGTDRVWVETRFRIVGKAVLQLGFDYNRNQTDKGCDIDLDQDQDVGWCEAGKTHWQFPSSTGDGWQVLTLR